MPRTARSIEAGTVNLDWLFQYDPADITDKASADREAVDGMWSITRSLA